MVCGKNNSFLGEDAKFIYGCPPRFLHIVLFDVAHVQRSLFDTLSAESPPRIAFMTCICMMNMQQHRAHAFVKRASSMDQIVM